MPGTHLRHEESESISSPRTSTSTSKQDNRDTAPLPLTAIRRTNSTTYLRNAPQAAVYPLHHQHPGAPAHRPKVPMHYPLPPPPSFPARSGRADGGSMLPVPLLVAFRPLPLPPPLAEYSTLITNPYPYYDRHGLLNTDHRQHHQEQQSLWQEPVIKHHDLPDEGMPLSSVASSPMSVGPCVSGTADNFTTKGDSLVQLHKTQISVATQSMDDWENQQEQANPVYIGNIKSMAGWENQQEQADPVYSENAGDGIDSLSDWAADEESTMGTIDSGTLSRGSIQPAIESTRLEARRTEGIRAISPEDEIVKNLDDERRNVKKDRDELQAILVKSSDQPEDRSQEEKTFVQACEQARTIKNRRSRARWTQEENEFVKNIDDGRRNVKNDNGRSNMRDKKIKLQAILAKLSDQPEDRTQEEKTFVQACEQARTFKNRRSRERLQERKNKLQAVLAKPPNQRSVVEQAYLEHQTAAKKRKNNNDRLRHARMKLKIAPRGSLPYNVCSTPSSQVLPPLPGHNKHNGSYNGIIHKDETGNAVSGCADGDNDIKTLDVAVSANPPRVHDQPAVYRSPKTSRALVRNAAKRRRLVEIRAIKPEDRTPGENEFLHAAGKQRKKKNDQSRIRLQETKHKLQTILAKSPEQRSEIEQAFLEQQTAVRQHKNRGDCARRIRMQSVLLNDKLDQHENGELPIQVQEALAGLERLQEQNSQQQAFVGELPAQEQQAPADCLGGLMMWAATDGFLDGAAVEDTRGNTG
jgi:hypothetical protein